jgi:hypothetical protein
VASHPCIGIRQIRGGQETQIEVRGWPGHEYEGWRAYTAGHEPIGIEQALDWGPGDLMARARRLGSSVSSLSSGLKKGRVLTACGWYGLRRDHLVAELLLHVDGDRPLQVMRFNSATGLVESDRYAVRNFLLACAFDISKALKSELGMDSGWLDWRVPERYAADVAATAPGFKTVQRRSRKRLRGTDVVLRRVS